MTSVPMDPLQLATFLQNLAAEAKLRAQAGAEPLRDIQQRGFNDVVLDLADAKVIAGQATLSGRGYGVTFLRRHSSPGALLLLKNVGVGQPGGYGMGPGDFIEGSFDGDLVTLQRAPGSATVGRAVLRVWVNPQAKYMENPVDELPVEPTVLLGGISSVGAPTFVVVAEDAEPTNGQIAPTIPDGSFDATGWKRLMVLIDTQSAGDEAESFALEPYYTNRGTGSAWYDVGETQRITFGGTLAPKQRFRACVVELAQTQAGLFFGPRNIEDGSRTGLGFCVVGIG